MNNVIKSVTEVAVKLTEIAEEGYSLRELTQIWAMLPIEDESVTNLEAAGECILQISELVDNQFPKLSCDLRTAKKYRLMSKLLTLKAEQLEKMYLSS